jgi:hypothetical protein
MSQPAKLNRLNLVVPMQILKPLRTLSEKDGRGVPELIRAAIIEFLAKNKQQ